MNKQVVCHNFYIKILSITITIKKMLIIKNNTTLTNKLNKPTNTTKYK